VAGDHDGHSECEIGDKVDRGGDPGALMRRREREDKAEGGSE
jgi:hypothetical protein